MKKAKVKRLVMIIITALLATGSFFGSVNAQTSLDLALNYVEGQAIQGEYAYDVSIYFSLLDSAGIPVKDIALEDLAVSEDGQQVPLISLDSVEDEPIYVTLVLDTSGSMGGSKIASAREAAKQFVSGLNTEDKISIISFNEQITQQLDYTTDHAAAGNQVDFIDSVPNSGTCLYDAAYQAIQKTSALKMGRRAVILLTDGKDELLNGETCSSLTIDDVIDLASEGNTRVPIYTIGLGASVDESGLKRMASLTGGRYNHSSDNTQLAASFNSLLDQLHSGFVAHYKSTAAPGSHTVVLAANFLSASDQDSRSFVLPAFPMSIAIVSPSQGQEIKNSARIVTEVVGQGTEVQKVVFKANDKEIGSDSTAPYEFDWKPASGTSGEVILTALIIGTDGSEISSGSITVNVTGGGLLPGGGNEGSTSWLSSPYVLYGGILLVVIALALIIVFVMKKRKSDKGKDDRWQKSVGASPDSASQMTDQTLDSFILSSNALGALTVIQSDDPAMIGQRFEISENCTHLGRAADNDILFPKDGAVSRHHAILDNHGGQLVLSEMVSVTGDGTTKTPTFGTYVNDRKIIDPTPLMNGDLIRLGKRLVLRFECAQPNMEDDARTMDQFEPPDLDRTMDA